MYQRFLQVLLYTISAIIMQRICAGFTVRENPKASLNTIRSSTSGEAVSSPTDIEYASHDRNDTPSQSRARTVPRTIPASRKNRNAIVLLRSLAIMNVLSK